MFEISALFIMGDLSWNNSNLMYFVNWNSNS